MLKNILLLAFVALFLSGCFGEKKEEKWTVFIYPDKNDSKKYVKSPVTFSTLDECKKVAVLEIEKQNLKDIAFFKCGLNCNVHEGMQTEICQEMLSSLDKTGIESGK